LDLKREQIVRRVVVSEVLRQAFASLPTALRPRATADSIHGNFGRTRDWEGTYRQPISKWIASSAAIDPIVEGLVVYTGLETGAIDEMRRWIRGDLVAAIDRAVNNASYAYPELSERLANTGLLPMFGFPTRIRVLYYRKPVSLRDDGFAQVADRSIDLAVSSFAPGSEVLRDKQVHTAVGFVAWTYQGQKPVPVDPLGQAIPVNRCPSCGAVVAGEAGSGLDCLVCQSAMEPFDLYQPAGFRTDYSPHDFDDEVERGPAPGMPVLALAPDSEPPVVFGAMSMAVRSGAEVFTINDNGGRLYDMYRLDGTVVVPRQELYTSPPRLPNTFTGEPDYRGAIGAVRATDVLLLTLDELGVPGPQGTISTDPAVLPAGRAALWSFAQLLRVASALELDINPMELQVGLQPASLGGHRTERIFLADFLENGAGYSTHLGRPGVMVQVFKKLLGKELHGKFESPAHSGQCDMSCPDCLRSYENRWLHPLLDWRLALDVAELVGNEPLKINRWLARSEQLVATFASSFSVESAQLGDLWAVHDSNTSRTAFFGHPLWRLDENYFTGEQASALLDAQTQMGGQVRAFDLYSLSRQPAKIHAWLTGGVNA